MHSADHVTDCAVKNMAVAVMLNRNAWLILSAMTEDLGSYIDYLFDRDGLFNTKTDDYIEEFSKKNGPEYTPPTNTTVQTILEEELLIRHKSPSS